MGNKYAVVYLSIENCRVHILSIYIKLDARPLENEKKVFLVRTINQLIHYGIPPMWIENYVAYYYNA